MIFTYILVVVPCVQDVTLLVRVQSHRGRSLKGEESKVETRINGKLKGKVRRESRIEQTSEATAPFLSNRASAFTPRYNPSSGMYVRWLRWLRAHCTRSCFSALSRSIVVFIIVRSPLPRFFHDLDAQFSSTNPSGP